MSIIIINCFLFYYYVITKSIFFEEFCLFIQVVLLNILIFLNNYLYKYNQKNISFLFFFIISRIIILQIRKYLLLIILKKNINLVSIIFIQNTIII